MRIGGLVSKRMVLLGFLAAAAFSAQAERVASTAKTPCHGTPMEKIEAVDFYGYFPTEQQAVNAAAEIDDAVFEIIVRTAVDGPDWVLRAIFRELPDADTYGAHKERLPALVKAHGGRYMGFGCNSRLTRR